MKALILAGGLGTRLREVITDLPKPMAEAGGRPFLAYLIEQLRTQGFRDIVLCVGYMAAQVESYFGDGRHWNVRVSYSVETELLGTAGAIRNAAHLVDGAFLVLNGDTYLEVDYRHMVQAHLHSLEAFPNMVASIAAARVEDSSAYGALSLSDDFRVERFREKVGMAEAWVNAGAYVLEPKVLEWIPEGCRVSLERETFPLLLERGLDLRAYPARGFVVDIGTPEGFRRFRRHVEEGL